MMVMVSFEVQPDYQAWLTKQKGQADSNTARSLAQCQAVVFSC
jgi:hypothetical protein